MPTHATCPLCLTRRARRSCPALDRSICPVCCATKRLVEIRCPATCPYLSSSRAHPAAVIQRRQDRDLSFFIPLTTGLTEGQYRLLLFFQTLVVQHRPAVHPPLRDDDLEAAAGALAATLESSLKGVIYDHPAATLAGQQLALALRRGFMEATGEAAGDRRLERDAAVALRQLETAARTAAKGLAGDDPPICLNLLERLMATAAAAAPEPAPDDRSGGSGLIITG